MKIDKIDLMQKLVSKTSPVETEVHSINFVDGSESFSNVSFFPIRDKVLIKAIFEESIITVKDEKSIRSTDPKLQIVAGVGNEVKHVDIGDSVKCSIHSTLEPVSIKGNDKDIKTMMMLAQEVRTDPTNLSTKVTMIEYYTVHESSIVGIFDPKE